MYTTTGYSLWLNTLPQSPLLNELKFIKSSPAAIFDRFWRDLEFGTGGLRGEIGAGTNRMNIYTVGKATQGLANFLLSQKGSPSVAIAYDTRNMSLEFAEHTACVLCANGIKVFLFNTVHPTPMLSFAVRYLGCDAGIVITASHNPKQYNGYKVYGADGGQITDTVATAILAEIDSCDVFNDVKIIPLDSAKSLDLLRYIGEDVDTPYFEKVKTLAMRHDLITDKAASLKILYSPLNGTGNIPVRRVLSELGFSDVTVVREQELPDGDFPTAPYPNPEEPAVFEFAIKLTKETDPDLIFATDPDCDRIGVLCKTPDGGFEVLTGNQTGALLCDYILMTRKEFSILPQNAAIIKTIVTTSLAGKICAAYGVTLIDVLTGFKYIGERIGEWERNHAQSFMFGFEESYGYLAGDFVRDKDAVIASALIAEMALYHKSRGKTLYEAMWELYNKYGYTAEKLISISMPGQDGQQKIAAIISDIRENYAKKFNDMDLKAFEDYKTSTRVICSTKEVQPIDLPTSNVLKFVFEDESWLVLRPSGTEPKMKLYIGAVGSDENRMKSRLSELVDFSKKLTGQ